VSAAAQDEDGGVAPGPRTPCERSGRDGDDDRANEMSLQCSKRSLSRAESDDSADRVIGRDAHGDTVARNHLDAKAAHATAQLRQYLVTRIALDPVKPAGMNGYYGSLHIYEIVLAQSAHPFTKYSNECATPAKYVQRSARHAFAAI
jgi:hypothetical protein